MVSPSPAHPGPVQPIDLGVGELEERLMAALAQRDQDVAVLEQRIVILEHQVQELLAMIEEQQA